MAEFSSLNGYTVKDNVARSIAKGRNQAVAFVDYETMIEALNELEKDEYKAGQNVYIGVVGVPDLWVYSVEDIRHTFIYESDEDVVEKLKNNTTIKVGFFKLAMLEGQKVDLTTYDQHLAKHDEDIAELNDSVEEINDSLINMQTSFQAGCNTIYNAVVAKGVTPKSKSPTDLANAVASITTDVKHSVYAKIINYKSNDTAQIGLYVDGVCVNTGTHGSLKMIAEYPMSAVQV